MRRWLLPTYLLGLLFGGLSSSNGGCGRSRCEPRLAPAFTSYVVVDAVDPSLIGGTVIVDAARVEGFQGEGFWLSYTLDGQEQERFWFFQLASE